jgi:hypothetical protein
MNAPGAGIFGVCLIATAVAAVASFMTLFGLQDDPSTTLGTVYRLAAFLQPVPYLAAAAAAVLLRRHARVLVFLLTAVVVCGAFGWWRIVCLADTREWENAPVTRNALGNIAPDSGGYLGAVEVVVWPVVVGLAFGGAIWIGRATRRTRNPSEGV